MLKIHKQTRAEKDLIEIWLYSFENWGTAQADRYLDGLDKALKTVATNPDIGVACDYIRRGYRKLHVKEHLIFYRCSLDTVHIIRVLGDDMDYGVVLELDD